MIAFDDDIPPAGTMCEWCKRMGHNCPARRYWRPEPTEEMPEPLEACICVPCGEGRDCAVVAARLDDEHVALARFDNPPSPVRTVTPLDPAKLVVKDEPIQVQRNYSGMAIGSAYDQAKAVPKTVVKQEPQVEEEETVSRGCNRMSDEVIAEIRKAPESITTSELARKLGVDTRAASYQRKKVRANMQSVSRALDPENNGVAGVEDAPTRQEAPTSREESSAEGVTLPVTFTESGVNAWWSKLSLVDKATIAVQHIAF